MKRGNTNNIYFNFQKHQQTKLRRRKQRERKGHGHCHAGKLLFTEGRGSVCISV